MAGKRSYDDPCGVARALDAIGERWALLVVRELLLGPKRFRDLARALAGLSENVLATRLRELEHAEVVRRYRLGPPTSAWVYGLTERGAALEPVLLALAGWGSRTPITTTGELSPDAFVLALQTTFDDSRAADLAVRVELRIDPEVFTVSVAGGQLRVSRNEATAPDAVLTGDVGTLRALVYTHRPLGEAVTAGDVAFEGDRDAAARLLRCFPRPSVVTETAMGSSRCRAVGGRVEVLAGASTESR